MFVSMGAHMWIFDMNISCTMWEGEEQKGVWSEAARLINCFIFNPSILRLFKICIIFVTKGTAWIIKSFHILVSPNIPTDSCCFFSPPFSTNYRFDFRYNHTGRQTTFDFISKCLSHVSSQWTLNRVWNPPKSCTSAASRPFFTPMDPSFSLQSCWHSMQLAVSSAAVLLL